MAEYYDESRNESPNILGMAGLLGLGALAGAGGYYALRNAKGRGAAAEALTRAARNERPRGVQMGDLSSRVTGDFGYDPRITGNTQLPNRRPARVTGDRGVTQSPITNDVVTNLPEVISSAPQERMVRRHGRMVPLSSVQPRVAPHAPEQYSNVPPSVPPTTPTSELRSQVYANVAAKPESELPRVYKPQGGTTEEMLITDPNTGEIYRRGGGGSYFASKAAELAGNIVTDLPEVVASAPRERMVRRQGRMVPLSSVQQKQPAIPMATVDLNVLESQSPAPVQVTTRAQPQGKFLDFHKGLGNQGYVLTGNPYDNELKLMDDNGREFYLKNPLSSHPKESIRQAALEDEQIGRQVLANTGFTLEQAEEARFEQFQRAFGGNPSVQSQATDAVESGAAQQTGRVWQQLSRNEDLDKNQIAQLNAQADADYKAMMGSNPSEWSGVEGDVAINTVAKVLPDGLPIDQAEGIGYDLRTGERFKFGGARPARTGLAPGGTIELQTAPGADLSQSSAARFLQQRREKMMAETGTPSRLETQLAEAFGPEAWREDPKATRRRNALKLGAAGNEQFFENLNEGTVTIAGEQFPVSSLKEGVYMEDTAQNLANKIEGYKDWLGNIRLNETRNQIGLATELDNLVARDAALQADVVDLGEQRRSFSSPQERDAYLTASRGREVALDLQDELDARINETLRNYEMSERRLAGAEKATARNIRRAAVPQKLVGGVEEGIVVRPVLTAPDNMVVEEGELSNIERGRPVGNYISQEQLEVVPGGLLSGGRARSLVNVGSDLGIDPETGDRILLPNVDVDTGETLVQKLAGKRMGADVNVRGRGGVAGLDTKASIGIYGPELAEYGTAAMDKEGRYTEAANRPPSATDTAVPVHKLRGFDDEGNPIFFLYPSSYEDPEAYKYSQTITPQGLESIDLSRAVQGIYGSNPRDLAEAKAKVGLSGMAQLAGKQLPPSPTISRFAATGPSTPLERTIQERTPEGQFKTYQVSNRPVAPTEEPLVRTDIDSMYPWYYLTSTDVTQQPQQLEFRSDVVPSVARARTTEADVYATNLANYITRMQGERTIPTSSPVVIQPNILVTEEYQLPLALSAGEPTPQMQGPVRASKQLRNFGPNRLNAEVYQPGFLPEPERENVVGPIANLTIKQINLRNRLNPNQPRLGLMGY
jgi:hypothetical protein